MRHPILKTFAFALALSATTLAPGCKGDDCEPGEDCHEHESELITSMKIAFTDSITGAAAFEYGFEDADGVGGNAPSIDSIKLAPNTTYNASVRIYTTHEGHSHEITSEIQAEDHEHLFCYTVTSAALDIQRTESDGAFPVGLLTRWRAGAAGSGTAKVVLRHQPDGQKDGSCTPGDTDLEVLFPVKIQ